MDRQEQLDLMGKPNTWPQWPVLPLENTDGAVGYMIVGQPTTVFLGNMWATTKEDPELRYNSVEEIYDHGWRID